MGKSYTPYYSIRVTGVDKTLSGPNVGIVGNSLSYSAKRDGKPTDENLRRVIEAVNANEASTTSRPLIITDAQIIAQKGKKRGEPVATYSMPNVQRPCNRYNSDGTHKRVTFQII